MENEEQNENWWDKVKDFGHLMLVGFVRNLGSPTGNASTYATTPPSRISLLNAELLTQKINNTFADVNNVAGLIFMNAMSAPISGATTAASFNPETMNNSQKLLAFEKVAPVMNTISPSQWAGTGVDLLTKGELNWPWSGNQTGLFGDSGIGQFANMAFDIYATKKLVPDKTKIGVKNNTAPISKAHFQSYSNRLSYLNYETIHPNGNIVGYIQDIPVVIDMSNKTIYRLIKTKDSYNWGPVIDTFSNDFDLNLKLKDLQEYRLNRSPLLDNPIKQQMLEYLFGNIDNIPALKIKYAKVRDFYYSKKYKQEFIKRLKEFGYTPQEISSMYNELINAVDRVMTKTTKFSADVRKPNNQGGMIKRIRGGIPTKFQLNINPKSINSSLGNFPNIYNTINHEFGHALWMELHGTELGKYLNKVIGDPKNELLPWIDSNDDFVKYIADPDELRQKIFPDVTEGIKKGLTPELIYNKYDLNEMKKYFNKPYLKKLIGSLTTLNLLLSIDDNE